MNAKATTLNVIYSTEDENAVILMSLNNGDRVSVLKKDILYSGVGQDIAFLTLRNATIDGDELVKTLNVAVDAVSYSGLQDDFEDISDDEDEADDDEFDD